MSREIANPEGPLPRSLQLMRSVDTALLLIDLQPRLLGVQPDGARIVWNARRLVDGARQLGVGVIATEQYPEKLAATVHELSERLPEAPVAKLCFSAAGCEEVAAKLEEMAVRQVLIAGIETHVCVQQTALDLLGAGYDVFVAADAVGSRFAFDHETALRRLEAGGAFVTTTEAALFEWCQVAGTDDFKAISGLAKEAPPA